MTVEEYEAALVRCEVLMKLDPKFGTPQGYELSRLVDAIEAYESVHFPMPAPSARGVHEFRNDQGMSHDDCAACVHDAALDGAPCPVIDCEICSPVGAEDCDP